MSHIIPSKTLCIKTRSKHNTNQSCSSNLILDIQVNILVNIVVLQLSPVVAQIDELVNASLVKVRLQVTLVLVEDLGLGFLASETVAQGSLDGHLFKDGAIVEGDGEGVGDGTLGRVVVVLGELGVLDAADALAEVLDERGSGGFGAIGVVFGRQTVEGQHGGDHVLESVRMFLSFYYGNIHT